MLFLFFKTNSLECSCGSAPSLFNVEKFTRQQQISGEEASLLAWRPFFIAPFLLTHHEFLRYARITTDPI